MPERLHKRLYIELPVCPEPSCQRVGRQPRYGMGNQMREWCTGGIENPHKKRRLDYRVFVESRAKVKADA